MSLWPHASLFARNMVGDEPRITLCIVDLKVLASAPVTGGGRMIFASLRQDLQG